MSVTKIRYRLVNTLTCQLFCNSNKMEFTRCLESFPITKFHSFHSNFNFARVFIAFTKKT